MLGLLDQTDPLVPDETEMTIAKTAAERLKTVAAAGQDINIVVSGQSNIVVPMPARAVHMILRVLEAMAEGTPISVIPHAAELTTQQAADYLNVSRPFLIKLLEEGKIPFRKVNRHRRVKVADLFAFEKNSRREREEAIAAMAAEAAELGLDD